jgi:glycosyltransferase involved in cell wall biosynthesis
MQKSSNLTVLIVNYNSLRFIALSLFSLLKLSRTLPEVYIIDNGSNPNELLEIKKIKKIYPKTTLFFRNQGKESPSLAHAKAINFLSKKVKTDYFMILDADCVILKKNWDEIFFSKFKKNIYAVGSQASGKKIKDFPLMYAVMFQTKIFRSLRVNFLPLNSQISINNDTGMQIREKFLINGYGGFCFKNLETRHYKHGVFPDIFCSEFYDIDINNKKDLLFSHFGRGSSEGLPKFSKSFFRFIPFLGKRIILKEALRQKDTWIYRCYQIIGSQI